MNCREVATWLDALLDTQDGSTRDNRGVPAGPELHEHLAACQGCREQHAAAMQLIEGLRLLPRVAPPAGFAQRMVQRALEDRVERRLTLRRRLRYTMALAASILLMVILGFIWVPRNERPNDGQHVKHEPPVVTPKEEDKPEAPPVLGKAVDEAKIKVASLTGRLTDKTAEYAKHLLAAAPRVDFPPNRVGAEAIDPAVSLRQAGKELGEGLEPVTRGARRAMDSFFREISTFDIGDN